MSENKRGRPRLINDDVIAKLETAWSMGCSDLEACLFAKIDKATLYRYQQENPDFCNRKEVLKQTLILKARSVIADALNRKDENTAKWYLEKKKKDEFSNRTELTGSDGSDLTPPIINILPVKANGTDKD
ncbi:MAG: hypothetical protein J6S85_02990 [Methanobrevibacter sp.]|nr:hypothetical protein [Methanobrevibacter sp.]